LSSLTEKSYNSLTDKPTIPTVPTALSAFSKDINFDERYYTESEINTLIQGTNNPVYKGDIASNADFAAIVTRTKYDQYTVVATATDAATGQTLIDGAEIFWTVIAWELIGNIDVPLKKIYINQTYTIAGEIKVAVGQTDAIIPFRMPIISGTSAKIVKVGYGIGGGTNAVFRMQKNGLDITAIGTKTATTIYTIATLTTPVGLADMDKLQAVISSVLDTPTNLGIDLIIEITL